MPSSAQPVAERGFHSSDLKSRVDHYQQALVREPHDPRTLYNLGLAQFESGDLAAAERTWLKTVAVDPVNVDLSKALVTLYARRGDADGVQRWNQRVTRLLKSR